MATDRRRKRNFSIIAHIDHGKTTLSDRLLERTHTIAERDKQDQLLDAMDLEREKGITIKSHPVTMRYVARDGEEYELNLLDTPGHVDFSYEVSRSLAACDGALLIVDAAQGVEAQTLANMHLAMEQRLDIVPIINKIDLPGANLPAVYRQLEELICIPREEAILCSAKAGIGIDEVLEAIVKRIPPPAEGEDDKLRALVFDSVYDAYRGVVSYVRVVSGRVARGMKVKLFADAASYEVKEVGIFTPGMQAAAALETGDVGYIIANVKSAADVKIGDTYTNLADPCAEVPTNSTDGVFRHIPGGFRGLREPEGGHGQTSDQRCGVYLFSGKFHRPGVRLSLRLSWFVAHGDYSGTTAARVQYGRHLHLSLRHLRSHQNRWLRNAGR